MDRNVVVGWDGTEGAHDALALAASLRPDEGSVTATWIYEDPDPEIARELLGAARLAVGRDADWLETLARPGSLAATGLRTVVEDGGAWMLAVGSSRHGPRGRVHTGGVGRRLLKAPPCAVALPPRGFAQHPHALRRIAVAFDGSHQLAAVAEGAALAEAHGVSLHLSCVVPPMERWARSASDHQGYDWNALAAKRHERFQSLLDEAVASLATPPGSAQLLEGRPLPDLLATAAAGADLMVLGPPGTGALERTIAGVTAGELLSAACPVLVVSDRTTQLDEHAAGHGAHAPA